MGYKTGTSISILISMLIKDSTFLVTANQSLSGPHFRQKVKEMIVRVNANTFQGPIVCPKSDHKTFLADSGLTTPPWL